MAGASGDSGSMLLTLRMDSTLVSQVDTGDPGDGFNSVTGDPGKSDTAEPARLAVSTTMYSKSMGSSQVKMSTHSILPGYMWMNFLLAPSFG